MLLNISLVPMTFPELIRSEEELLEQLLLVSQRQIEIVEMGNANVLVYHLGRRQRLWQEFERLEQQLTPHKGIPAEQRIWKNADERQQTEKALNRCKILLEKIMENDQISLAKTAELKDKVEKDLRRVQLAASVAPAYLKQSQIQQ